MGPVLEDEYLARAERYDRQMREKIGVDPEGRSVKEKLALTREYRMSQYDSLTDAVFKRRGWTSDGCPTPEHLVKIGMDLPEVLEVVQKRMAGKA
jgi:aldehyde:ferredoxin oxidoreductase